MLVVAEGPTGETAFGYLLEKLFANRWEAFYIIGDDMTAAMLPGGGAAQNEVRKAVLVHIYAWQNLDCIVQIVDLDGALANDGVVVTGEGALSTSLTV